MVAESQKTKHELPLIFGPYVRLAWTAIAILTISLELTPFHNFEARYTFVAYLLFYGYKALKALLFLILGFLTPIAFWRFRSLTYGLIMAAISAFIVELLQGFLVFTGHSFGWFELIAKLFLIFVGFMKGLDARYEGAIRIGSVNLPIARPSSPGK
jgi:hypothetical protein